MVVISSFSPPTEGIKHEEPSTLLLINGREIGHGTLYIAESALSWKNNASGQGFSLLYPNIAIHGVAKDIAQFGHECLYLMLDTNWEDSGENEDSGEDQGDGGSHSGMTEMRFAPENAGQLDAMYQAMTHCQSLHPDPDPSNQLSEDEYEDADEEGEYTLAGGDSGYIEGHPGLERSNGWRNTADEDMEADGQFEDAVDED